MSGNPRARPRRPYGVLRAAVILVLCSLAPSLAAAQGRCTATEEAGGELITWRAWTFDAQGRIATFAYTLDPAAFSSFTRYRYGANGELVEERTRIDEGPAETGWQPAVAITVERRDGVVVARRPDGDDREDVTTTWLLDERGRPTSITLEPGGEEGERFYCASDLAGRPVYMGVERGEEELGARRWEWEGDRLVRVVSLRRDGREEVSEVRHPRRGVVEIRSADGESVETFRGACAPVIFERCAPAYGPALPDGSRARVPRLDGPAAPRTARASGPRAFGAALDARLTLAALRRAYAGLDVWTSVSFYENAPNVPFPIVCVGRAGRCTTVIEHDASGHPRRATTTDPELPGPGGVRAGAASQDILTSLEACTIETGLETGIACRVRGAPGFVVWLDATEAILGSGLEAPTDAMLRGRRVVHLEWQRPEG